MDVVDALRRATEDDVEQAVVEGYFPMPQMTAADPLAFLHVMIDRVLSDHVGENQRSRLPGSSEVGSVSLSVRVVPLSGWRLPGYSQARSELAQASATKRARAW